VKDYQASIEKLRKYAAEAALIRDLATDTTKREMYDRLHQHLSRLADEVEHAMKTSKGISVALGRLSRPTHCGGAAILRRSRPAVAHHVITATRSEPSMMGYPFLWSKQTCAGHAGISDIGSQRLGSIGRLFPPPPRHKVLGLARR
jgi:hypothetical protein